MTVSQIKMDLCEHLGNKATIKYNLGRNKFEKYNVTIKELYDYIFLVECENSNSTVIKSFSYIDVITKRIKIDY